MIKLNKTEFSILLLLSCLFIATSASSAPHQKNSGSIQALNRSQSPSPRFSLAVNSQIPQQKFIPEAPLEYLPVSINSRNELFLSSLPKFKSSLFGQYATRNADNNIVLFSIDPALQKKSEALLKKVRASHAAIVVMEPATGKILSIAGKSPSIRDIPLHPGFPAASVFKIITSAAALEQSHLTPTSQIKYRGSNYTLNKYNYKPSVRYDRKKMSLTEALGRSCNPVFARVALQNLSPFILQNYSRYFGFNQDLGFDIPMRESGATIPESSYELSRTAAGFGKVHMSPVHAVTLISTVANRGLMPRPYMVDKVITQKGKTLYQNNSKFLRRSISSYTADKLMKMMEATTTIGTARTEFYPGKRPRIPGIHIAGKTGTLSGKNPKGLNKWFVAAAPLDKPEIALAVVVVNPGNRYSKATYLGRQIMQYHFESDRRIALSK